MNDSFILSIPGLSRELTLLGYKKLPYKVTKKRTRLSDNISKNKEDDFSEDETPTESSSDTDLKFKSLPMLKSLVETCFKLIKHVKALTADNDNKNEEFSRLSWDHKTKKKKINLLNNELKEKEDKLKYEIEKNRQLIEKIENLNKQLKFEKERETRENLEKKHEEKLLKNELKKKSSEAYHLSSVLWKKFNQMDVQCVEDNLEVLSIRESNLNKLWSDVKYSKSFEHKEDILKKAICRFEENNQHLLEENLELRHLNFMILENLREIMDAVSKTVNVQTQESILSSYDLKKLYLTMDLDLNIIRKNIGIGFKFINIAFNKLSDHSFTLGDKVFVCWSDIIGMSMEVGNMATKQY